jgi:uncharacterized protein
MLVIEIPRIPPEGQDVDEALDGAGVHLENDSEISLERGHLRGHVELVDGANVHVRGDLDSEITVQCGRCLERYSMPVKQDLDLFYLPRLADRPEEEEEDVQLDDHDVVVGYYEGEKLDLGEVVREQLFLALPLKRICREDCQGICPTCGRNRNADRCECPAPEEPLDPRLEPLRKLVDPDRH